MPGEWPPGPITLSSIFGGEDYDARLEQPGWDRPGFDDSKWQTAESAGWPRRASRGPIGSAHQGDRERSIAGESIAEPKLGVFVYDLGQNFSGWPKDFAARACWRNVLSVTPAEAYSTRTGWPAKRARAAPATSPTRSRARGSKRGTRNSPTTDFATCMSKARLPRTRPAATPR